jgi:hypothetical protein
LTIGGREAGSQHFAPLIPAQHRLSNLAVTFPIRACCSGMLAMVSLSFRADLVVDEFARLVVKPAQLIANGFQFCAVGIRSRLFVVVSCVVWPTRCGVGHTYFSRTGNGLLA